MIKIFKFNLFEKCNTNCFLWPIGTKKIYGFKSLKNYDGFTYLIKF